MIIKTIAAESCHWYSETGEPRYEVEGKNGMRPTTLRDARKLNLFPSVTTILGLLAKPGLEKWKLEQAILASLTLPRFDGESADSFAVRVISDSKEQGRKAMDKGTAIHTSLEQAYKAEIFDRDHELYVGGTLHAISNHFGIRKWVAEKSFSHPLGYGGKVDLFSGDGVVIDFKTTEFNEDKKDVGGYDEHLLQLAAYAQGLGLADARLANVYVSTSQPGLVRVKEWEPKEAQRGLNSFNLCLKLWQSLKDYMFTTTES